MPFPIVTLILPPPPPGDPGVCVTLLQLIPSTTSPPPLLLPIHVKVITAPLLLPLDDVLFMLPSVPHEDEAFGEVVAVAVTAIEEICRLLPSKRRRGTPDMLLMVFIIFFMFNIKFV